jgi:TonB-linked SusC/RagA family outer membrane protein
VKRRHTAVPPGSLSLVFLSLCALLPIQTGRAQQMGAVAPPPETGTIAGVVTAVETATPLPNARVTLPGTVLAATAGADGHYTIALVPPGTYQIRAQLIGHAALEVTGVPVTAGQTTTVNLQLQPLAVTLEQVVVVGYGTQARKDVTGSVGSVSSADLQAVPKTNAVDAIKGRVAGVDVISTGNKPGDGIRIRVRGERSLSASNDPLYVLDGIPIAEGIGDLSPNDIESIDVLKDASATAIYGSRGANGVVLITTRQGKSGRTSISYDTYAGVQQPGRLLPVMNGPEFAEFKREANRARGQYKCNAGVAVCDSADEKLFGGDGTLAALQAGRWTNWQDLVLQDGTQLNNEVRIAGGDERTRFALSAGQLNQRGIMRSQDFRRRSMRLNFDHHPSPRLRIGTSSSLIRTDQNLGRGNGLYSEALSDNPLGMVYDSTGKILFKPTPDAQRVNPLSDIQNWKDDRARTRVFGTLFADYSLTNMLNWRVNFGADLTFYRRGVFRGAETQAKQGSPADAGLWGARTFAYTLDNILTYRGNLGADHRVDATLLYSIQDERTESDTEAVTNLPYEGQEFYDLGSAINVEGVFSRLSQWKLQSVMARVNYAFKDRYLLTVTSRLDGSSRLAPGHKYALFPSVAVAWRLGEEGFIRRTGLFSDLKLRASYGRTGNTAIAPYQTQGSLSKKMYAFGGLAAVGYGPGTLPNRALRWEQSSQADVGLEFATLNGRISGSVDVYRANTQHLLMARRLPPSIGYDSIVQNVGATRNTGLEVALSAEMLRDWHGLRWNTQLNWAANRNRIVSLYGGNQSDVGNRWFIGYPDTVFYDYQFAGIWQRQDSLQAKTYAQVPGQIRVVDVNSDGRIDDKDRVILGSPFPAWTGSITNRFDWKGMDLSVMAVARWGFMVFDRFRRDNNTMAGRYNNLRVNYWTPANPSNTDPRPNAAQENPLYGDARCYQDGSFVRVRSITLGYSVPRGTVGPLRAQSLRIYATALDPFMFTDFQGLDPEAQLRTTGTPTPSYWTVLMGVTVGL